MVALVDESIVKRYMSVVQLNRESMGWSKQTNYPGGFPYMRFRLTPAIIADMLAQRFWIASLAPADGYTDRLAIDLDSKDESGVESRNRRYSMLREVIGLEFTPLVYQTPSGHGIRVVYRIPRTPRADLLRDASSGLLPEVLRAAGLPPDDGSVEVYPHHMRPDRLPLGRRMPLLDASTLAPIPDANIGDVFDAEALERALRYVERWHAAPHPELLERLSRLPRNEHHRPPVALVRDAARKTATTAAQASDLLSYGLVKTGTRRRAEWIVGMRFISEPERYAEYGLTDQPTSRQVAMAIARWLATRNNNQSTDWNRAVAKFGSENEAEAWFVDDYLTPDRRGGQSFIDRLYSSRAAEDPSYQRVLAPSRSERQAILAVAERHFPPGSQRYRFECWTFAYVRAVKIIAIYHTNRGTLRTAHDTAGHLGIEVELLSSWMKRWPYGAGESQAGTIRYVEYLAILREEGILRLVRPYRAPGYTTSGKGSANIYAVREPNLNVRVRDVGIARDDLASAIEGLRGYGNKPLSIDEAYHALHVLQEVADAKERYGKLTAQRIDGYLRKIHSWLELHRPTEGDVVEDEEHIEMK